MSHSKNPYNKETGQTITEVRAYRTFDGKLHESVEQAESYEFEKIAIHKLKNLVRDWFGYEVADYEVSFVANNILKDRERILRLLKGRENV